jgi:FAD/FMN-containing dehydrogenase
VGDLVADHGGSAFQWHTAPEERSRMWSARHTAYWASIAMRPGCRGYPTDVCVPISQLAPCVLAAQRLCRVSPPPSETWKHCLLTLLTCIASFKNHNITDFAASSAVGFEIVRYAYTV